ncbi:MAG TPA: CvpA family protein [Thermoanaerobaculaceae bacterium]|nr:CvpA family protein [Thermoanaerobaculaceae bacterium]
MLDPIILLVVAGCAIAGLVSGAIRLVTWIAAVVAAVVAGHWAGPGAASLLLNEPAPGDGARLAVSLAVGLVAALLVWFAGLGLRRGLAAVHLGCLDRIVGMTLAAATATALLALLLGLAALGGHPPTSPLAARLAAAARPALEPHSSLISNAIPTSRPTIPTNSGQHPH